MAEPETKAAPEAPAMAHTAVLAGSTGQVGSHILTTLLNHPNISQTYAYTRRPLPSHATASPKLTTLQATDNSTWASLFPTTTTTTTSNSESSATPTPPTLFLSGLATTRSQAGSLAAQRLIDYDLNLTLARTAHAASVPVYVLISGTGASSSSIFPYVAMKGALEDAVRALGFKHTVLVRPGMIVGNREKPDAAEACLRWIARAAGRVGGGALTDFWAQDAEVIARAAVRAGVECAEGRREEGVWILGQGDIIRLGKAEFGEDGGGGSSSGGAGGAGGS